MRTWFVLRTMQFTAPPRLLTDPPPAAALLGSAPAILRPSREQRGETAASSVSLVSQALRCEATAGRSSRATRRTANHSTTSRWRDLSSCSATSALLQQESTTTSEESAMQQQCSLREHVCACCRLLHEHPSKGCMWHPPVCCLATTSSQCAVVLTNWHVSAAHSLHTHCTRCCHDCISRIMLD